MDLKDGDGKENLPARVEKIGDEYFVYDEDGKKERCASREMCRECSSFVWKMVSHEMTREESMLKFFELDKKYPIIGNLSFAGAGRLYMAQKRNQ